MELPPRDSLQDRIMVELLQRERLAKVKEWEISLAAIGSFIGHQGSSVESVIIPLRTRLMEELFHLGYDVKRLHSKVAQQRDALRERREQIERVKRMG